MAESQLRTPPVEGSAQDSAEGTPLLAVGRGTFSTR